MLNNSYNGYQQSRQPYNNMQGNMQNNMQGNMQNNMQGNMQNNMQGNMQNNMQQKTYKNSGSSWGITILMLFIFFPVGIYMMMHKLHTESQNIIPNANKAKIVGWVYVGAGILYLLMGASGSLNMTDGTSSAGTGIMMLIIFVPVGLVIVHHAKKYAQIGEKFNKYLAVLENSVDGRLDSIANTMKISEDQVVTDLQQYIDKKMIDDTYINSEQGIVVGPIIGSKVNADNIRRQQQNGKSIKCPNCGAINKIGANHGCCEYCGNPLK